MKKIIGILVVIVVVWFAWHIEIGQEQNEINNADIVETVSNTQENQEINQQKRVSLDGKTIGFLGDSLIKGYGNEKGGFMNYLSLELPNTMMNDASKSGSTITSNTGTDNIIMFNQIENLTGESKPEIVVLDGGANDMH